MTLIVVLLVLGALLLFLEVLLPGLVSGILGAVCLVAAVVLSYSNFGTDTGNVILAVVVAGLIVGTWGWLRFFPQSRLARRFISRSSVGDLGVGKPEILHCTGVAISMLRPSGTAFINGKRTDVVTEGGLIEAGAPIKVIAVEGQRVVVRPV